MQARPGEPIVGKGFEFTSGGAAESKGFDWPAALHAVKT